MDIPVEKIVSIKIIYPNYKYMIKYDKYKELIENFNEHTYSLLEEITTDALIKYYQTNNEKLLEIFKRIPST